MDCPCPRDASGAMTTFAPQYLPQPLRSAEARRGCAIAAGARYTPHQPGQETNESRAKVVAPSSYGLSISRHPSQSAAGYAQDGAQSALNVGRSRRVASSVPSTSCRVDYLDSGNIIDDRGPTGGHGAANRLSPVLGEMLNADRKKR